jgi:uncharacterized protein (TIGR02391 family)
MAKTNIRTDVFKMLANTFPELCDVLEREGQLRQSNIRPYEMYAIYRLLKRDLLSMGIVLFLGFSHGDYYPISSIAEVLKVSDAKIAKTLQKLKAEGLVYSKQLGLPLDFYAIDREWLLSAIKDFKLKKIARSISENETNLHYLYEALRLHSTVRRVSESLFKTGHYAQAIFEAFKCIEVMVREKSGITDRDGQALMAHVLNESEPILRLNPLHTTSEKNEQIGFKFIFMGCMTGVRNPKAHDIVKQRDPYRTLEYLSLASLLAKRVNDSTPTPRTIKE